MIFSLAVRVALDSLPAPSFDVVARPNDWTKPQAIAATAEGGASEQAIDNSEYWAALDQMLEATGGIQRRTKKVVKGQNLWVPLTTDGAVYVVAYRAFSHPAQVGAYIGIYGEKRQTYWDRLTALRPVLEAGFGASLRWEENRTGSVFKIIPDPLMLAPDSPDRYAQLQWLEKRINRLAEIFQAPVRGVDEGVA